MNTPTRFDELLPFYVNGTLSATDRAWVDGYLDEHPTARRRDGSMWCSATR